MPVQFSSAPVAGAPGQVYDTAADNIVITKIATTAINFGEFVSFTDAAGTCHVPNAAGEIPGANGGGVALIDEQKASGVGYEVGDAVKVLIKGRAWVKSDEALAHGDAIFVRYTAPLGAFRNDAGTSEAAALTRASVFQPGAANLAVVSLS